MANPFSPGFRTNVLNGKPTGQPYVNEAYSQFGDEGDDNFCRSESDYTPSQESSDEEKDEAEEMQSTGEGIPMQSMKRKSTKKDKKVTKTWDVFRETSEDNLSSDDLQMWNKIFFVTKIIFSAVLLVLILSAAILSKSTLSLIIANILPPKTNMSSNSSLKTADFSLAYNHQKTNIQWIWSLVLIVIAPYTFTVFLGTWTVIFKKTRPLECKPLFVAVVIETIYIIGLNLFVFGLLPNLDPVSGALLCTNVTIVPAILGLIFSETNNFDAEPMKQKVLRKSMKALSLVASLVGQAFWCYYIFPKETEDYGLFIIAIISPILLSIHWWENFVPQGDRYSRGLQKLKRQLRSRRTKISTLVNLWKIVVTIGMVSMIYGIECEGTACLGTLYGRTAESTLTSATFGHTDLVQNETYGSCSQYLPLLIAAINIVSSVICYRLCISACKILAQVVSFSVPLALATPVTVALMVSLYTNERYPLEVSEACILPFPKWTRDIQIDWPVIVASIVGYIAFIFITNYIWTPSAERLQRAEKLFVTPLYCGVLLDQSMLLNRRKDEEDTKGVDEKERDNQLPIPENIEDWNPGDDWSPLRQDDTPFIYLCATMWHETENEMTQILKSLFRMDEDQCARRNLQLFFGIRDPDYYEFEAHIFFDDAFEYDGKEAKANGYVKQLIQTITVAVSSVHSFGMKIPPPTKIDTPYGGRLIWRLPGGNKMIAHLKDKSKIRHRKRWSQVMYMYYFLAHKLLSMGGGKERLKTIADNTFLLALDGDVDFQPSALRLLVDRMKRNPNVGAACGRIHPIGSGPMVWYQKFEYAVSHWLQKATEHTIGCVLCSPGCFSLFRGSSVMDDNVMRRYTTPPTEARHYVQYDQGEDRWLCTLLLQQGYRVEYCAASDALTYAPEGFYEFFNQRRRWTPSTMANIMDLLMDWKNVTKRNNDISSLYIGYQMLLMASSILTPGTIFLLVLGAINMAYPDLPLYGSLILNLLPVVLFILLCFIAKSDVQLAYAAILSTIYSLVMMLVIVGLLRQAAENGFCSVTTVFLCGVAGIFVVSAFLHPQEFWCIIHGFLYFLAIPSMSMLLMLYSLGNLHVVSWGTREAPKPAVPQKPGDKPPPKKGAVQEVLEKLGFSESTGTSDYMFSFGNLFRCLCCPKDSAEKDDLKFRAILDRLDDIEAKMTDRSASPNITISLSGSDNEDDKAVTFSESSALFEGAVDRNNPLYKSEKKKISPWIVDKDLMDGAEEVLKEDEVNFWKELVDTYLYPLEEDKKHQEKTKEALLELRNTVCLFFLLINALFVTIVYTLQQISADTGTLSINLPCATDDYGEAIEPISLAFTAVFGILLVIQFICMIFHRTTTFLHICAITEVKFRRPKQLKPKEEEITVEKGLQLVRDMMGANDDDTKSVISVDVTPTVDDDDDVEDKTAETRKRDLWGKLARRRREQQHGTLSQNFLKNFKKLQKYMNDESEVQNSSFIGQGTQNRGINLTTIDEDEEGAGVDAHRLQTVRKKFNRFERKSLFTIVQMSKDKRLRQNILERGEVVANRWKRVAMRVKLNKAAAAMKGAEGPDGKRQTSKVTMADIASLAVAANKSRIEDTDDEEKF